MTQAKPEQREEFVVEWHFGDDNSLEARSFDSEPAALSFYDEIRQASGVEWARVTRLFSEGEFLMEVDTIAATDDDADEGDWL